MINLSFNFWKFKADNMAQFELKKTLTKIQISGDENFLKHKLTQKYYFRIKNINKTEVPKMTSKVVHELLLRNYGHFKVFRKLSTKNPLLW